MKNDPRKPAIVMTPKSLLRHPQAVSTLDELARGRFEPVLHDVLVHPADVKRVVFTCGKVYYDLKASRDKASANIPVVRIEQLYPFPQPMIVEALKEYEGATEVLWVQEEPRNMDAWPFLHERLLALLAPGQQLRYVGGPISASPATGSHHRHEDQQRALVEQAIS